MSHFMGVGIFWIGLNPIDLGCWRLTLMEPLIKRQLATSSIRIQNKLMEITTGMKIVTIARQS